MSEIPGDGPVLWVAPHAPPAVPQSLGWVPDEPALRAALADRVSDWHDGGTDVALAAACAASGGRGLAPTLPRGLVDLNRPWKGRVEEQETLFGKGALDAWTRANLVPGGAEEIEGWHRAALLRIAAGAVGKAGLAEVHSFGDLGSSYDRAAGGRPVRRAEVAVVTATPWHSARPVGLSRLIPADFRGTPWALERAVSDAMTEVGLRPGPSPYPPLSPWAISVRFVAARWFAWAGRTGLLPEATATHLADLAWTNEQDPQVDAVAAGSEPEPEALRGVRDLARRLGAWTHEGAELGDRFHVEDRSFSLVVELRIDKVDRAADYGRAAAAGIARFLAA